MTEQQAYEGPGSGARQSIPSDLVAVVVVLGAVNALVVLAGGAGPLGVLLGLPAVLVLPGYVLVATLFPGRVPIDIPRRVTDDTSPDDFERLALSFATSLALLPMLALALSVAPAEQTLATARLLVTTVVFFGAVAATVRRYQLPPEDRYQPVLRARGSALRQWIAGGTRLDTVASLILVVALLLAATTFAYAVAAPPDGETYTEFTIGTDSDTSSEAPVGELQAPADRQTSDDTVAAGYPTELTLGEPRQMVATVENHESQTTEYTLVVTLETVLDVDGTPATVRQTELHRERTTLDDGAQWRHAHTIEPDRTGDNMRVRYYLYRGTAPPDPDPATAYRTLHFWTNVTSPVV